MDIVTIDDIIIRNANPAALTTPFDFELLITCRKNLAHLLTFKLVYIGSPIDAESDQELECIQLGPLTTGTFKFPLTAEPPNFAKIDAQYIHGTTALLLEVSYLDQEFVRVGWYITNSYNDDSLEKDPPEIPILEKLCRKIHINEPRVTKFKINWNTSNIVKQYMQ